MQEYLHCLTLSSNMQYSKSSRAPLCCASLKGKDLLKWIHQKKIFYYNYFIINHRFYQFLFTMVLGITTFIGQKVSLSSNF